MTGALDPQAVIPAPADAKKTRKVLVKKAKKGVDIKKYAWLAGHGLTVVFGGIYLIFYTFRWFLSSWWWTPRISYKLSFIGVVVAYSVSILTTFGKVVPSYHTLMATENFQNLVLAFVWIISRSSAFKLIPYYFVALLQLANMFSVSPILKLQDQLSDVIATSEIVVIFALIFDTLLFRGTSGFALAIYLMFYWLRILFSSYTQAYLIKLIEIADEKVMKKQKPEIQAKWKKCKDFVELRRSETALRYNESSKLDGTAQQSNKPVNPTPSKPQPAVAAASGRISATTPPKHSLDPRQELIQRAQKANNEDEQIVQADLTEVQKAAE